MTTNEYGFPNKFPSQYGSVAVKPVELAQTVGYNDYGLANNFASQYGSNTSLNQYEDLLTGKLPGANIQTPSNELGATTRIAGSGVYDSKNSDFMQDVLEMDAFSKTAPSTFQGAYTGILKNTGQIGTSTDPMDFKDGSINKAIWADENGINEVGMGTDTSKDLLGMNPEQWGSALKMGQIGIGAGRLGLGLASYFQNKGLANKQKELLGQQIESNRSEMDARKNYRSALEGFGSQSQPTRI